MTIYRYQYDNHLGSACLELDDHAEIISYEEYHPFGTTSYRSGRKETEVSLKRYKYIGKERDNETGLYYYGARYYAAWLCRWISTDPAGFVDGPNLYAYVRNNPLKYSDPTGMQSDDEVHQVKPPDAQLDTSGMRSEIRRLPEQNISMESKGISEIPVENFAGSIELKETEGPWRIPMRDWGDPNDYDPYIQFKISIENMIEGWIRKKDISLVNKTTFSGFKKTDPAGCFNRVCEMLSSAGFKPVSSVDKDNIQMTKSDEKGHLTIQSNPNKGIDLINSSLEHGKPITVGVDYKSGNTGNVDNTTDQWIVIVGRGYDESGFYFHFFDPQTADKELGTSINNKLRITKNGTLSGKYTTKGNKIRNYTVTMVRPSVNKKE